MSQHPRRILFVCSALPIGGFERQWSLLIPRLRQYAFDVSLLTLVGKGAYFDELVARGIPASCAELKRRTDLVGLKRALRHTAVRPGVVVSQGINAHIVGHIIARRVRAHHVTVEHAGPDLPIRRHRQALTRLVAPHVDRVIAISEAQIPRLVKLGYRQKRIIVIYNGAPELTPSESRSTVRARLGFGADIFLAVLVANLRPEKSVDLFLHAIRAAHRADPSIRGLVVGGGSELERLRHLAANDRIVRLLGERSDVPDILAAGDAACLSSTAEALPMALIEAMALSKPIVATNTGGIPELLQNEKTGLVVPVGDERAFAAALLRLAANRALGERLGRAANERYRTRFHVERMVNDYVATFNEILEGSVAC